MSRSWEKLAIPIVVIPSVVIFLKASNMPNKVLGWVPGGTGRVSPFDALFASNIMLDQGFNPDDVAKCDAVVVWGGADISPTFYGEEPGPHMYVGQPSRRDILEWDVMQVAKKHKVPVIGICRGAQMLCAAAGGKLWQHTDIHGNSHPIVTNDGKTLMTSSVHHQMMRLDNTRHEVLAVDPRPQTVYDSCNNAVELKESPEVVDFPEWGLAIQGHPEFMDKRSEFVEYCLSLIQERVIK
jgi:putative glutamine amidotransferase